MVSRFQLCACCAIALLLSRSTAAQEDEPPPEIRPTVTVQSGDIGGLFFGRKPDPQKTRQYFIAAEKVRWDFAPSGRDEVCGLTLPPPVVAQRTREKLRYIQYTDATFKTRVLPQESLGILGPMLRGVVGEFLAVTFLNRTSQPLSMHPHGLRYDVNSEGAYHFPTPGRGAAVGPGATFTYVWLLDEESGPRPDEPSSKAWLYHSHVLSDTEANLGLIGGIIVTDPKRARPNGTPADVDREFATLFMVFNEADFPAAAPSATGSPAQPAAPLPWSRVQELTEQGERYSLNGRIFGNLRGLDMNEGERTRWYLFGLGSERDFHTAHWHGLRALEEGRRRTDVIELLPASMKVADLTADNPGAWLYHCHVAEHMREGMFARFTVYSREHVGVSRAPEVAFLGLAGAARSLRVSQAEIVINPATRPARAEVIIIGTATVPDPLNVTSQPIRVQLGERSLTFQPGLNGLATIDRARLRILNSDERGVAPDGLLDFELTFSGPEWLNGMGSNPAGRSLPLVIEVGSSSHSTLVTLVPRVPPH